MRSPSRCRLTRHQDELMKRLPLVVAVALTGCGSVAVYESAPTAQCMVIAPIKYSLYIPADSADQGTPLKELRARVLESCKNEARNAGANALFITDRSESDVADRKAFTINCSGMAYACP